MRSTVFWIVFLLGYASFIGWNVYKLRDIARNPEKYDKIKGIERYWKSYWNEPYKNGHKHYFAHILTTLPLIFIFPAVFWLLAQFIQRVWLVPNDVMHLRSIGILVAALTGAFLFGVALIQLFLFSVNKPIFIAARLYWSSGDSNVMNWRNTFLFLLILGIICLPVMAIGINAYSYADEEKIVTHGNFALREKEIPYTSVVSGETAIVYVEDEDAYTFQYCITMSDGTQLDIIDYGIKGAAYIDSMLQRFGVAVQYGDMDAETYAQIKKSCDSATVEFAEQCFTIKNGMK